MKSTTSAVLNDATTAAAESAAAPMAKAKRRLKLLFLAHRFPPLNTSGCVRARYIATHLTHMGWDVTVVTPHPSVWKKVDDPELTADSLDREGIRRIYTDQTLRCLDPEFLKARYSGIGGRFGGRVLRLLARRFDVDRGVGWIKRAELACATLTPEDVDVILATGTPFASFDLARRLSAKLGRPYVLDYRDPWTQNPHADHTPRRSTISRERMLVQDAAAVTIVSPSWAEVIERCHRLGPKLHVVTNGYDTEELSRVAPEPFGHFAIVYTGTFYRPKRVITPLMAALNKLKQATGAGSGQWYFHYYGNENGHVLDEAKRFDLLDRVLVHGIVPRKQALAAVRGAGIAVVITSVLQSLEVEDRGIVTGKVFEALGLKTPILLISPSPSDVESIIESAGAGRSFTGGDVQGITDFLNAEIREPARRKMKSEAYDWTHISRKLDSVLRQCAATRHGNRDRRYEG